MVDIEAYVDILDDGTSGNVKIATDVAAILVDTGTTLDGKINTIDTNVDAILVDTGTTLPATLTTIEGKIDTVDTVVDAILADTGTDGVVLAGTPDTNVAQINSSASAAVQLALSTNQIITFTVDTVTNGHTPTTTEFQADDITEATADHYNGRIVIFTSGALAGQATDITDYAAVGGIGQFTVTAMTEAPANDDAGIIL